jgi:outer membrane protein
MLSGVALAQPLKIGFVNAFRIDSESTVTKNAVEQLKKEFAPRELQLQAVQKQGIELKAEFDRDGDKLKPAERANKEKRLAALSQQFEQMQRSFTEDMEFRQREIRARLVTDINAVITRIADAEKFDLVLQQAIFASGQIDLTDRVLKEMAGQSAAGTR